MRNGIFLGMFVMFLLTIGQVHFLDAVPGRYSEVYVDYNNLGNERADNTKITLMIPDLNVYDNSGSFDVAAHDNGLRVMLPYIPTTAQRGWYPMWTILSNDESRTWQFDWIYVE